MKRKIKNKMISIVVILIIVFFLITCERLPIGDHIAGNVAFFGESTFGIAVFGH